MPSSPTIYCALWRKDLRNNALVLGVCVAACCLGAVMTVAKPEAAIVLPVAAMIAGTLSGVHERTRETRAFLHSLPLTQAQLLRARLLFACTWTAVLTTVSGLVHWRLGSVARELIHQRLGESLEQQAALLCVLPLVFALATLTALVGSLLGCVLAEIGADSRIVAWATPLLTGVVAALPWLANAWYDVLPYHGSGLSGGPWRPDWLWVTTVCAQTMLGVLFGATALSRVAPLEVGRRAALAVKSVVSVCLLVSGVGFVVNSVLVNTDYDQTRRVTAAAVAGDQFVAQVTASRCGREIGNRLWSLGATTGEVHYLARGSWPEAAGPTTVAFTPARLWGRQGLLTRRLIDLSSGAERPLAVSSALRCAWESTQRSSSVAVHSATGHAVMRSPSRRGFLATDWTGGGPLTWYSPSPPEELTLVTPTKHRELQEMVCWSSDGEALVVGERASHTHSVPQLDWLTVTRLWWVRPRARVYQPLSAERDLVTTYPQCLSPTDRWVYFFVHSTLVGPEACDLYLSDTHGGGSQVVVPDCPLPGTPPRWSPKGDHLALVCGKRHSRSWQILLLNRTTGKVQRWRVDPWAGTAPPPLWHPVRPIFDQTDLARGAEYRAGVPVWSPEGTRFAVIFRMAGCRDLEGISERRYEEHLWTWLWIVTCDASQPVRQVLLGERERNRWASESWPAEEAALTWNRHGEAVCLTENGRLLTVDPDRGDVVERPGSGGQRQ